MTKVSAYHKTYLPTGQKCLQAGFRQVTYEELWNMLGCAEVRDIANQALVSDMLEEAKRKKPDAEFRILKEADGRMYRLYKKNWLGFWSYQCGHTEYVKRCTVAFMDLNHFVATPIPEAILEKVRQARELGVAEFRVAYPEIVTAHLDPAVVGMLGEQMILIGKWDGEE